MKNIIIILFVLLSPDLLAQNSVSFTVIDSVSKQAVPFLKIVVVGKEKGTYSDEHGFAKIDNLSDYDTISIDNIFYQRILLPTKNLRNIKQIILLPKPFILNEAIVKPYSDKEIEIGYSKIRSNGSFGTDIIGTEITVLIKPGDIQNAYINFIILKFKYKVKNTQVRVHLYQNEQGKPGTEIYIKDNLISVAGKDEVRFNIVNQHIKLPLEGMFVSMEWIGNNKVKGEIYNEAEFKSSPRVKATTVNQKRKVISLFRSYGKWEPIPRSDSKVYLPLFGLIVQEQK